MEEKLDLILKKLEKLDIIEIDFKTFKTEVNSRFDNLEKKTSDNLTLLLDEQDKIYKSLDKKLSNVENKLEKSENWQKETGGKLDTLLNTVDSFVNRTVKVEEEIIVINHQVRDHEDRITELETIE